MFIFTYIRAYIHMYMYIQFGILDSKIIIWLWNYFICRFLFFTLSAGQQGLYRIDTGDITSPCNITSPRLAPYTSIVNDNFLTFTLDFNNILIYFPDESHNSMRSSSLDGGDVTDIRRTRTVRPEFQGMVGMVYYDELFYWTNGDKVMQEEYNSVQDKYYHNQLLMFADHFSGLNVLQRSLQPKPGNGRPWFVGSKIPFTLIGPTSQIRFTLLG